MATGTSSTPPTVSLPAKAATVAAGVGQLVVGYFTLTATGLIAVPVWGIALLAGAWLAASAALVHFARRRSLLALFVPVVNALVLWSVVAAGGAWFGWSA